MSIVPRRVPMAPEFTRAISAASAAAADAGSEILTEQHLLLGVLADDLDVTAQVLVAVGVGPAPLRARLEVLLTRAKHPPPRGLDLPYSGPAARLLRDAVDAAVAAKELPVRPHWLVIKLLTRTSVAATVLTDALAEVEATAEDFTAALRARGSRHRDPAA